MAKKNPFVLKWSKDNMLLSDGSRQKEFYDHEEAMEALDEEISKVELELACTQITLGVDTHEYHRLVELEVTRVERGVVKMYGVSLYYILPKE